MRKISFSALKNILSYYLLNDNFIFEFKSKNKLFFYDKMKESDKILRMKKLTNEYEEWGLKKIKSIFILLMCNIKIYLIRKDKKILIIYYYSMKI